MFYVYIKFLCVFNLYKYTNINYCINKLKIKLIKMQKLKNVFFLLHLVEEALHRLDK
jgi:hypothetical protein